jgi:hypothetical protein
VTLPPIRFPQQLYRLIPILYPRFAEILHRSKISGPAFFALSYVKNTGKEIEPGVVVLPVADLKNILVKAGEYDSGSGAHGFITTHLQNHLKYLQHHRLTPEQKREFFPDSPGYRDAVSITALGYQRIAEVNKQVEQFFNEATTHLTKGITGKALKALLKAFSVMAGPLIDRLEDLARQKNEASDSDDE